MTLRAPGPGAASDRRRRRRRRGRRSILKQCGSEEVVHQENILVTGLVVFLEHCCGGNRERGF